MANRGRLGWWRTPRRLRCLWTACIVTSSALAASSQLSQIAQADTPVGTETRSYEKMVIQAWRKLIDKSAIRCKNDYFIKTEDGVIREFRNLRGPTIKPLPLTELDRLNGYEWRGVVTFDYALSRVFGWPDVAGRPDSSWSDWEHSGGEGCAIYGTVPMAAKRGTLTPELELAYCNQQILPITCSDIPADK
jgi:hypothetical protein